MLDTRGVAIVPFYSCNSAGSLFQDRFLPPPFRSMIQNTYHFIKASMLTTERHHMSESVMSDEATHTTVPPFRPYRFVGETKQKDVSIGR